MNFWTSLRIANSLRSNCNLSVLEFILPITFYRAIAEDAAFHCSSYRRRKLAVALASIRRVHAAFQHGRFAKHRTTCHDFKARGIDVIAIDHLVNCAGRVSDSLAMCRRKRTKFVTPGSSSYSQHIGFLNPPRRLRFFGGGCERSNNFFCSSKFSYTREVGVSGVNGVCVCVVGVKSSFRIFWTVGVSGG